MGAYIVRRLLLMLVTLFGMSILIFVMLRLVPGNITDIIFNSAGFVNPAQKAKIERELGLDQPIVVQYVNWIGGLVRGDLGYAYVSEKPAIDEILPRIPVTAKLAALALIFSVLFGVPLGVISAVRQNTALDYVLRVISLSGLSLPSFWLGLLILMAFVHWFGWIPIYKSTPDSIWEEIVLLSIPAAAVGFRSSALVMRLTRSSMLEVLRQDYIRTARAKGASERLRQLRSRAAQRRAAGRHHHRHRGRIPDRRPDRHRDRVQHPGRGALPGRGHPLARLSDRAEPGDVHRRRRGARELHRRHDCTWCSIRASSTRSEAHVAVIDHQAELARAAPTCTAGSAALLFFARRYPLGAIGAIIMILFVATALFADAHRHRSTRSPPTRASRWRRPAASTSLGADFMGRDVFAPHRLRRAHLARRRRRRHRARLPDRRRDRPDVGLLRRLVRPARAAPAWTSCSRCRCW